MLETLKLSCFPENPSKFFIKHTFMYMASGGLSFSLIENFPAPAKSLVGLAISMTPHVISTGCLHPASFQKLAKGMHCEFVRGKFFAIHAPCSLSQGVDSFTLKLSYKSRKNSFLLQKSVLSTHSACLP